MVKRLRLRPLTPATGVRIPVESPQNARNRFKMPLRAFFTRPNPRARTHSKRCIYDAKSDGKVEIRLRRTTPRRRIAPTARRDTPKSRPYKFRKAVPPPDAMDLRTAKYKQNADCDLQSAFPLRQYRSFSDYRVLRTRTTDIRPKCRMYRLRCRGKSYRSDKRCRRSGCLATKH